MQCAAQLAQELQVTHDAFEKLRFDHAMHQLKDEPAVGDPDWDKNSMAVIVCDDNDDGWVMFYVGAHLDQEIDNTSRRLSDLGLGGTAACTPGVWIWEGCYCGSGVPSMAGDYSDPKLVGTSRRPTEAEWAAIRAGENPWKVEDWVIMPERCCGHDNCDRHSTTVH